VNVCEILARSVSQGDDRGLAPTDHVHAPDGRKRPVLSRWPESRPWPSVPISDWRATGHLDELTAVRSGPSRLLSMHDADRDDRLATAAEVLRTLRRTRQIRSFTDDTVAEDDLQAILEVARWTGSSTNLQPWTFVIVRRRRDLEEIARLAPNARHVAGAALALALAMDGQDQEAEAYDEGRVAERVLIAANALDLGGGIGWIMADERAAVAALLGISTPVFVRTVISLGHPSDRARLPRSAQGAARKPLADIVRDR
jgi:nitroreductase